MRGSKKYGQRVLKTVFPVLLTAVLAVGNTLPVQAKSRADWLNSDIIGTVTEETQVSLQDDFAAAAVKEWRASAQISGSSQQASSFTERAEELDEQKRSFMTDTSLTGHDAELVQNVYSLFMDWETRDALGVTPLMEDLGKLQRVQTIDEMTAYLIGEKTSGENWLKGQTGSMVAFDFPKYYTVGVLPMTLSLGDSAEYTERTRLGEITYRRQEQRALYILGRVGYSEEQAQEMTDHFFSFETKLAQFIRPTADSYAEDYYSSINNGYDREGLAALAGDFPLLEMLDAVGLGDSASYLVTEPEWVAAMQTLYTQENLEEIRDYLIVRDLSGALLYLDHDAFRKVLEITETPAESMGETEIAYQLTSMMMTGPMQNLYVQKYGSEETKREVEELIDEVLAYYRQMLMEETWLSEETRNVAIGKLDNMSVYVGYSDEMDDYSDLTIRGAQQGGTIQEARTAMAKFAAAQDAAKVNTMVEPEDNIFTDVTSVNAGYYPQDNSIQIPLGILGGDFYNPSMSREQKLGAIGAAIGHEITHAFDTTGSQFDKDGVLNNWWTEEDYAAFSERVKKVEDYYSSIIPMEGAGYYNGAQVQDEATADLGGLKCMLAIAAQDPDFNYDEFFRSYANMWKCVNTEEAEIRMVQTDVHPLGYLRINVGLQQFQEFYDTYDIQPGDGMYLAPEERLEVW
ncbi:MAG: M13 family metallopeptidase [Eubacteriales bacterium]|nr:M13 family metallopeptidase [Eubacteriales bacterium]